MSDDLLRHFFNVSGGKPDKPRRRKNRMLYFPPPKDWKGTIYQFGYTPWRTGDPGTGKAGFWALKYKFIKTKNEFKLVKSVRFAKRKVATARAEKWFNDYYHGKEEGGDE